MNYIYRIKITEHNDGTKEYTPQVSVPVSRLLKWIGVGETWLNIIENGSEFIETEALAHYYQLESKALEIIEKHKQYQQGKHAKQTKEITYRHV